MEMNKVVPIQSEGNSNKCNKIVQHDSDLSANCSTSPKLLKYREGLLFQTHKPKFYLLIHPESEFVFAH